jgi:DNA modification methylase
MASQLQPKPNEMIEYLAGNEIRPLFLFGDSRQLLKQFPAHSIDCCMTSPPYWGHRQYSEEGIGLEADWRDYIKNLIAVTRELKRVLKPEGSFWLNIGDSYQNKNLLGIPWRVAIELTDRQGWILRNSVIWHKVKGGPDNAADKLRNVYEHVFHSSSSPSITTPPTLSGRRHRRREWKTGPLFPQPAFRASATNGRLSFPQR